MALRNPNVKVIRQGLAWISEDRLWLDLFFYICSARCYDLLGGSELIREFVRKLELKDFAVLLYMISKFRGQDARSAMPVELHRHGDIAFAAVKNFSPGSNNRPDHRRDSDFCYIISDAVLSSAGLEIRRKLGPLRHNVYWSRENIEKRLEKLDLEGKSKISISERDALISAAKFNALDFLPVVEATLAIDFHPPILMKIFEDLSGVN